MEVIPEEGTKSWVMVNNKINMKHCFPHNLKQILAFSCVYLKVYRCNTFGSSSVKDGGVINVPIWYLRAGSRTSITVAVIEAVTSSICVGM